MDNSECFGYYFEENRNAWTPDMLDKPMGESDITLRQFINYGVESAYVSYEKPLEQHTTEELSHMVDWIDYLDTK